MRQPKNMQSDARKAHMRSFLFGMPVVVDGSWWWSMAPAAAVLLMEMGGVSCVGSVALGAVAGVGVLALDAAVLVQVDVVAVVALEGPEDDRDEHDRAAEDRDRNLGAPEARVLLVVRRVHDGDADGADQDAEARQERIDRLERHVDAAVGLVLLRMVGLLLGDLVHVVLLVPPA